MTDNQERILKEIQLYYDRKGIWPNITTITFLMGVKSQGSMSTTLQRMVNRGYIEYVGEWKRGQTRQVKTC